MTFGEREVALSTGAGTAVGLLLVAFVKQRMPVPIDALGPPCMALFCVFVWRRLGRPGGIP